MTIKKGFILSAVLATISLALPVIWLKIGPGGYTHYGPDVPDVYILGSTILGKDRSFLGINIAYKFQLLVIVYFILSNLMAALLAKKKIAVLFIHCINSILLLLFPFWLWIYTHGVINNSDMADLTVYPHVGVAVYLFLAYLNFWILRKTRIVLNQHK